MVTLRATQKVLKRLPAQVADAPPSDTALGDWYANRLVVDRQPLVVLVSSHSLLPIVTVARDMRSLPERLPELVMQRLRRFAVSDAVIRAEGAAMRPVLVAPTRDRSVLGIVVEFSRTIPIYLPVRGWDETTLPFLEMRLAETPCRAASRSEDVIFPDQAAPRMLMARWHAA